MPHYKSSLRLDRAARKYGTGAQTITLYRVPSRPLLPAASLLFLAALSAFYWAFLIRAALIFA